jgi:hypothetical protein
MSSTTNVHPEEVLKALLAQPRRSNVKRTLQALHDLCRKNYEAGVRDFSIAGIGHKAEEAGLFVSGILYNPSSKAYKDLITAWGVYAGPIVAVPKKNLASYQYLMRIEDPAIRTIMQGVIAERDTLKAQINLIKGSNLGIVDLRSPRAMLVSHPEAGPTAVLMPDAQLMEVEREALRHAISAKFLADECWSEGERGEIKNAKGRILFKHGFTSAIRKILGEQPQLGVKVGS